MCLDRAALGAAGLCSIGGLPAVSPSLCSSRSRLQYAPAAFNDCAIGRGTRWEGGRPPIADSQGDSLARFLRVGLRPFTKAWQAQYGKSKEILGV